MLAHQCVTCRQCVVVISSALCAIHGGAEGGRVWDPKITKNCPTGFSPRGSLWSGGEGPGGGGGGLLAENKIEHRPGLHPNLPWIVMEDSVLPMETVPGADVRKSSSMTRLEGRGGGGGKAV